MIKTINALKSLFSIGEQATEDSFTDLIDSSYNKSEDSLLLGPLGLTGRYGLLGPTGGTHLGLYLSAKVGPLSPSSSGATGEVVVYEDGGNNAYFYVHNGSQWYRFDGLIDF
jgi:hypothetical protein